MQTANEEWWEEAHGRRDGWLRAAELLCFVGLIIACFGLGGAPTWGPPVIAMVFSVSMALYLLPGLMRGDLRFPISALDLAAFLFLLLCWVSRLASDIQHEASKQWMIGSSYAMMFFVCGRFLWRKEAVYRWTLLLLGLGALEATYGMAAHLRSWSSIFGWLKPEIYVERLSGTFINPNHFGSLMGLLIPLGLMSCTLPKVELSKKMVAGYVTAMMGAALLMTYSRGAWASAAFAVILVGLLTMKRASSLFWWWALALLATMAIVVLLVWAGEFEHQLSNRADLGKISDVQTEQSRLYAWADTLNLALQAPVTGVGLGCYPWLFPSYQSVDLARHKLFYAHNDYLQTAAELGLGGLFLQMALVGGVLMIGFRVRGRLVNRKVKGLMTGLLAGFAGVSVHALVDFPLRIPGVGCLYALIGGLLVGIGAQKGVLGRLSKPSSQWAPALRGSLFFCVLGYTLYTGVSGVRSLQGTLSFQEGHRLRDNLLYEEAFTAFQRCAKLNPDNWKAYCEMGDIRFLQSMWLTERDRRDVLRQEAREFYHTAQELNPWHSKIYVKLSHLSLWSKNREKARALYEKALEVDPHNVFLQERYAQIFEGARIRGHLRRNQALRENRAQEEIGLGEVKKDG